MNTIHLTKYFLLTAALTLLSSVLSAELQKKTAVKKQIKIAIIDTGVDTSHELLKNLNWSESYDFVTESRTIVDGHGHGTHIAGIIAQSLKRGHKIEDFQFLSLRYYSLTEPHLNLERSKKALRWAIEKRVNIINYSGGGYSKDNEEYALIKKAEQLGIVVITSAGNRGTDKEKFYPAAYHSENLIRVAAVNKDRHLASFSNYGLDQADFAALGEDIESTLPGNRKGSLSGTSQATAIMTAQVATELDENVEMDFHALKKALVKKTKYQFELKNKVKFARVFMPGE